MNLGLLLLLLLLLPGCHLSVLPANLAGHMPQVDNLSWRLQTHNLEGSRSHHPLFLPRLAGSPPTLRWLRQPGLCWSNEHHASTVFHNMHLEPDAVGAMQLVGVRTLAEEGQVLVSVEIARNFHTLTA